MKSGEGSVQSHKLSIAPYCAIKLLCSPFSPFLSSSDRPILYGLPPRDRHFIQAVLTLRLVKLRAGSQFAFAIPRLSARTISHFSFSYYKDQRLHPHSSEEEQEELVFCRPFSFLCLSGGKGKLTLCESKERKQGEKEQKRGVMYRDRLKGGP